MSGEVRYRLQPLALPAPGTGTGGRAPHRGPAGQATQARQATQVGQAAVAGGAAAVALFADRARQADPHFTMDAQALPLVAEIVARLDGMPLAIELAAVRVEALGLAQLLDRLGNRFGLLTGGDRTAAARRLRGPVHRVPRAPSAAPPGCLCSVRASENW